MPEVFDDLTESHRALGVTADARVEPTPASPTPGTVHRVHCVGPDA
jgi:hypothetical protein